MAEESFFEQADAVSFDEAYKILDASFPEAEKRSYEGQKALLEIPEYELLIKKTDMGHIIALLGIWHLDDFDFIEHAAVSEKARGGGIGSRIFQEYFKTCTKMIFLEVEHPNEEDAKRRIKFYKRLGFHLNSYEYYQPSLKPDMPELPLYVMTYPNSIDEAKFECCKSALMNTVYHKKLQL
ncbi:MAG: GNAT family N-acetyltransferase [Eubacterium sp.]